MNRNYFQTGTDVDRIFFKLDNIIEDIHKYVVEPDFSQDVKRRAGGMIPSFDLTDEYILQRMILLIAFSQQAKSSLVGELMDNGAFERIFASYSPKDVAKLDPEYLKNTYWDNPSKPRERLAPLRFPSKLNSMVDCAKSLMEISARHGSFMKFLQKQGFPLKADTPNNQKLFWDSFEKTRSYLVDIKCPFFSEFTSLCHLLQDIGFDCAKPDSVVMGVAARLGIIESSDTKGQKPLRDRKVVIQFMQKYSAYKNIKTSVLDLYFLIYGGQSYSKRYVRPEFYSLYLR